MLLTETRYTKTYIVIPEVLSPLRIAKVMIGHPLPALVSPQFISGFPEQVGE